MVLLSGLQLFWKPFCFPYIHIDEYLHFRYWKRFCDSNVKKALENLVRVWCELFVAWRITNDFPEIWARWARPFLGGFILKFPTGVSRNCKVRISYNTLQNLDIFAL